jgi:hypothetical protein
MSHSSFETSRSGETSVAFSSDLANALSSLNVQVEGFGSTDIIDGVADFSISGGAADIDSVKVDIIHDGGLTFKAAGTTIDVTDFIITNLGDRAVLTGLVSVDGNLLDRVPLFDLNVGGLEAVTEGEEPSLSLFNVGLTLAPEAASALAASPLSEVFGTTFPPGFNVGTAQVDAKLVCGSTDPNSVFDIIATSTYEPFSTSSSDITRAGETAVTLSTDLVSALGALQVQAGVYGNTNIGVDAIAFPITGGAADLNSTKVDIIHDGGLTLSTAHTTVDLTDFIITNLSDRTVLNGLVSVNGDLVTRAPLFDVQVGSIDASLGQGQSVLNINDVNLTLTLEAASTLNQVFGVTAFTSGFNIGTAQVEAFLG